MIQDIVMNSAFISYASPRVPNDKTDRRRRRVTSELETDAARLRSVQ
jgi:hypothetical protein